MNEPVIAGDRVRLLYTNDIFTRLQPGAEGTVMLIDVMGTIHVNWDSGSSLGLVVEDGDRYEKIN